MWLYKVAYKGWEFSGSQIQPDVRTVEGELGKAVGSRCRLMSRTDAGVSARGNVLALGEKLKIDRINAGLDGVAVWAMAEADSPRVRYRHYRYFLVDGSDPEKFLKFNGTHDFARFTKARKDTVRTLKVRAGKGHVDFFSRGFLWNQVRRIVGGGRLAPPESLVLVDIRFENEPEWMLFGKWLRPFRKDHGATMSKAMSLKTVIE